MAAASCAPAFHADERLATEVPSETASIMRTRPASAAMAACRSRSISRGVFMARRRLKTKEPSTQRIEGIDVFKASKSAAGMNSRSTPILASRRPFSCNRSAKRWKHADRSKVSGLGPPTPEPRYAPSIPEIVSTPDRSTPSIQMRCVRTSTSGARCSTTGAA